MQLNARFWAWINDGWVKLTLTQARPDLVWSCGGPTDEGSRHESHAWRVSENKVYEEIAISERDCDGPTSDYNLYSCHILRLRDTHHTEPTEARNVVREIDAMPGYLSKKHIYQANKAEKLFYDINSPQWQSCESEHRDYVAEKAGY